MKKEYLNVDIYINSRYFKSFKYKYSSIFVLDVNDIKQKAVETFPSLKNKNFEVYFIDNQMIY